MFAICLIFSGIAMFLNGFLPLIDENDNNEIVIINVLSGLLITILSIYGIFVAVDTASYLAYASLLLFAFTHLYIAAIGIWDFSERTLGWLAALIAVIVLAIGLHYLIMGSLLLGIMWLIWMLIWVAYFISRALDALHTPSSWVIMLIGVIGLCGAGILLLTNTIGFIFI